MNFRNIILLLLVSSTTIWANNDEQQKNIGEILCDSSLAHLMNAGFLCLSGIIVYRAVFSNEDYSSLCIRPYFSAIASTVGSLWSFGFAIYTGRTNFRLSRSAPNRQNGTP